MLKSFSPYWQRTVFSRVLIFSLCASGIAAIVVGLWHLEAPVNEDGIMKSAAMATLVDDGQSLCNDLGRIVQPAIQRTQLLATDPEVRHALLTGDRNLQTQLCNVAITKSTEIDAVALFNRDGNITAINTVYATGKPIAKARVDRILKMNFQGRDIIQKCTRNNADEHVLEFQTACDITPAFFDSTGLSVAYSVPVFDPITSQKIGVISSRVRFERLTDLIRNRDIGGTHGSTQFVTDKGGYFSEEINSGKQAPPIPQKILADVVRPLVQGSSDYCFTQKGNDYLCVFRLKQFSTVTGGGIQVMVVADENWLMGEVRQAKFFNCGALISLGLFLVLCATVVRSMAILRQSEKWNRLLIHSSLDAVIAIDNHSLVRAWNPQAEKIFGYNAREVQGQSLEQLILSNPSAMQTTGYRFEVQAHRKDGEKLTVEMVVTSVQMGDRPWKCIFARDMTEQRITETHLAQSQKLESIGQMAAGIAHEINTPTQYVGDNTRFVRDSFVQLLSIMDRHYNQLQPESAARPWHERYAEIQQLRKEMDLDFLREEIPKAMDQSIEGLSMISKIVGAMKEFSHPGGLLKDAADLNGAIESTTIVCRNRWKSVSELELHLDPNLPRVSLLLGEFNQVMLNLIVNAADAITEASAGDETRRGLIQIFTRSFGENVEIRVQDNGPGIPPAVTKKIFEPFFTTKPVGKGTGQGLMISRNVIVKKHGGQLRFEPAPGGGTVFIITLPISDAPQQRQEAA
jgi:PAS domain S-box-containing protein